MGGKNSGRPPDVKRRAEAARLRAKGVSLKAIARQLGVSRQAVYGLLKYSQQADVWPGMLCASCGRRLGPKPRRSLHPNGPVSCLVCLPADATLGQRLKSYRLAAGLSQAELEKRTGIHRDVLSGIECEEAQPMWATVEKLIKVFGVALVDMGKHFLDRPVADLGFSVWTDSLLARTGVRTIRQLRQRSARTLESSGFMAMPLREVRVKLAAYGLSLAGE